MVFRLLSVMNMMKLDKTQAALLPRRRLCSLSYQ